MGWDDEEEWPRPGTDPASMERRRATGRAISEYRRRALRWAYFILFVLLVVVVVIALTR